MIFIKKFIFIFMALVVMQVKTAFSSEVTSVLISKSKRTLSLLSGSEIIKTYHLVLGRQPLGAKKQEGDQKTPEGDYLLDWKNPQSKFTLSIHINYPNKNDILQARKRGVKPGSAIMLHGLPNNVKYIKELFKEYHLPYFGGLSTNIMTWFMSKYDWTQGCIAFNNSDMEEIYNLISIPTPIKIIP